MNGFKGLMSLPKLYGGNVLEVVLVCVCECWYNTDVCLQVESLFEYPENAKEESTLSSKRIYKGISHSWNKNMAFYFISLLFYVYYIWHILLIYYIISMLYHLV